MTETRVLIAYATRANATQGVAEAIGKTLQDAGVVVHVGNVKRINNVDDYSAVVIGSGIRAGRLYGEAVKFVEKHRSALAELPVAYFVVCLTMAEPTEENCEAVDAYLDPLREAVPEVAPVNVGLFAGALDYNKLSLPLKMIMRMMDSEAGDFRDWDAIRAWAEELHSDLLDG
jgi:menaquinone-dependent protoporphyrinogen oxidase